MILTKIIFDYLQTNRRITVPALGTFLSKGDDTPLLFSEFMKGDEGVLRGLLSEGGEMSELEAAIFVDRFVFDVRHSMECGDPFTLPHLGYISSKDGRTLIFTFDPEASEEEAEEAEEAEGGDEAESTENTEGAENTEITEPAESAKATEGDETREATEATESAKDTEAEPQQKRAQTIEDLYRQEVEQPSDQRDDSEVSSHSGGGLDWWIVAAIIALILAISALLYGLFVEWFLGNISFGEPVDGWMERGVRLFERLWN